MNNLEKDLEELQKLYEQLKRKCKEYNDELKLKDETIAEKEKITSKILCISYISS